MIGAGDGPSHEEASGIGPDRNGRRRVKRLTQFAVSLVVGSLILYALLRHFDLGQAMASVRQAQPRLLILGVMLMVVSYLLRGARWRIWERSLSYWDSLRLILIGFMGNSLLPARLGEILRAHCAAAKTSDDRGRTTALASIAAERILDGLILRVGEVSSSARGTAGCLPPHRPERAELPHSVPQT